jgi:hypothetical protein
MNCRVCGKKASFRFCSNKCFLAYAKTRKGVRCAVCSYDPRTGRIGDPTTTKLCDECKRAPENRGWSESWENTDLDSDIEAHAGLRLDDVIPDSPQSSELADRIRALAALRTGAVIPRALRTKRARGQRPLDAAYTTAQIAERAGCSVQYVRQVLSQQF